MFSSPIQLRSVNEVKSELFFTRRPNTVHVFVFYYSLKPQFCCPFPKREAFEAEATHAKRAGRYSASAATDLLLSHTNTQEPMQVAWLTESKRETESIQKQ